MAVGRLLNGEGDGDHVQIPEPPPPSLKIPRIKPLPLDWFSKPPNPDDPPESSLEIDTYNLGRDLKDGHVHRDKRGRYLYWYHYPR